jgi:DNA polymerase III delta prime subunit
MLSIITAEQRASEPHGVKMLLVGPPGVGKTTSSVQGLLASTVFFVDVEAGTLSIADVPVDIVRPQSWPQLRDLAVRIGGVDPAAPFGAPYSAQHLEQAGGPLPELERYQTIVFDSLSAVSRLSFRWAETQPEAFSERTGKKDIRGAFGLHARELIQWSGHLQHIRTKNIILIAVLELRVDEFNRPEWRVQIEGSKAPREIMAIVDEVITMQWIDFGDAKPVRAFICSPNEYGYPAKDRSGRLNKLEEPNLGKLISKLNG